MRIAVPRGRPHVGGLADELAPRVELAPFRLADDSAEARWTTRVGLAWDAEALQIRFDCRDEDAWSSHAARDAPLWQEEAVEVFVAAGEEDPREYFEFEVSPSGALFDALVVNPHGDRREWRVDPGWDCPGIRWRVGSGERGADWWARLAIPFRGLGLAGPPTALRANFFRIERPRGGEAELSCWRPTLTSPADFHRPARFGLLDLIR